MRSIRPLPEHLRPIVSRDAVTTAVDVSRTKALAVQALHSGLPEAMWQARVRLSAALFEIECVNREEVGKHDGTLCEIIGHHIGTARDLLDRLDKALRAAVKVVRE